MDSQTTPLTQNERLLGAAAHTSVLLGFSTGNLPGLAIPVLIWLTQREKSRWVGFQSLQAIIYQVVGFVVTLFLILCWLGFFFVSLLPLMTQPEAYTDAPPPTFIVSMGSLCIPFAVMGAWVLYGLYGALRAYAGADFRYVIIGDWLARRAAGNEIRPPADT